MTQPTLFETSQPPIPSFTGSELMELGLHIRSALDSTGWILISNFTEKLGGADVEKAFLSLCKVIGNPIAHDRVGTIVWDIKTREKGEDGSGVITYSEHNHEADLHTDSQYSKYPEDYFGLLTLKRASCGGGASYLLSLKEILKQLRSTADGRIHVNTLSNTKYPFIVPNVFRLGEGAQPEFNYGPILRDSEIRFRIDTFEKALLAAPEICTVEQIEAFEYLKNLIRTTKSTQTFFLETGDLLFINNKTMLHGRSSFNDPGRHLLRIRMNKVNKGKV